MSIFDKFSPFLDRLALAEQMPINPFGLPFESFSSPTRAIAQGKELVLAGTNNYLGLTFNENVMSAAKSAIDQFGTGTTGSRMANGSYRDHLSLEDSLGDWLGMQSVVVCTTGYQANLAAISTLVGPKDMIMIDMDSHASIYDACTMSKAKLVRFRHNDPKSLDEKLTKHLPDVSGNCLVVIEGLYSMFGDVAPVADFIEVCKRHGVYILIDEAHSVGVFGEEGRGVAEQAGVLDDIDFFTGTFSKSFGTVGGFCASPHRDFARIAPLMRSYTFTAAPSPADAAAAKAALPLVRTGEHLRDRLWNSAHRVHEAFKQMGFDLCAPPSPIIAARVSGDVEGVMSWTHLVENGVYVNLAVPPTTPKNSSLLRLSLSAAHTDEDIEVILSAFEKLASIRGMVAQPMAAE
ncbi:MAG: aminotransferase class I/II-fold pyridoxal phosphate-dependent enzyme [Pseudomonadota bacterium]